MKTTKIQKSNKKSNTKIAKATIVKPIAKRITPFKRNSALPEKAKQNVIHKKERRKIFIIDDGDKIKAVRFKK